MLTNEKRSKALKTIHSNRDDIARLQVQVVFESLVIIL